MENGYLTIRGQQDFESFLREYFSSKQNKPLVILSKPFSGRTSVIGKVADELGIPREEIDLRKKSLARCPSGFEDLDHKQKDMVLSFDEWMELNESKRVEALKQWGMEERGYRYNILELEPDFVFLINDLDLERRRDIGTIYKSEKYTIVLYIPFLKDWVVWAKQSKLIHPKVIEFAEAYPVYYYIEHNIYNRLSYAFDLFLKGIQEDKRAFSRGEYEDTVKLYYENFLLLISETVTTLFWDFIKDVPLDELFEH